MSIKDNNLLNLLQEIDKLYYKAESYDVELDIRRLVEKMTHTEFKEKIMRYLINKTKELHGEDLAYTLMHKPDLKDMGEDKEKTVTLKSSEWETWLKFMIKQTVKKPEEKNLVEIMEKVGKQMED